MDTRIVQPFRDYSTPPGLIDFGVPWPPGSARDYGCAAPSGLMVEIDGEKEDESYGMRREMWMDSRRTVLKL